MIVIMIMLVVVIMIMRVTRSPLEPETNNITTCFKHGASSQSRVKRKWLVWRLLGLHAVPCRATPCCCTPFHARSHARFRYTDSAARVAAHTHTHIRTWAHHVLPSANCRPLFCRGDRAARVTGQRMEVSEPGVYRCHLLRVVLLRVLESNFPGDSL